MASGLMQVELLFISGTTRTSDQAQEAKTGSADGHAVGYTLKTLFLVNQEDTSHTTMELRDFDRFYFLTSCSRATVRGLSNSHDGLMICSGACRHALQL